MQLHDPPLRDDGVDGVGDVTRCVPVRDLGQRGKVEPVIAPSEDLPGPTTDESLPKGVTLAVLGLGENQELLVSLGQALSKIIARESLKLLHCTM